MQTKHDTVRKSAKKLSSEYRGGVAVGIMIGVGIGIVLTLGLEVFIGSNPLNQPSVVIGLVATMAAITSSFLALLALSEQRRARQAGTDPVLIAHFSQRDDAREMIMLSLSNVGAGAAMNVRLTTEADFDPQDYAILTNIFSRNEPFRSIRQNTSVNFNFGVGFEILGDKAVPPFTVKLEYLDIDGDEYSGNFTLDVREMEKLGAENSLQQRQTKATESISKNLGNSRGVLDQILLEVTDMKSDVQQWRKNTSNTARRP